MKILFVLFICLFQNNINCQIIIYTGQLSYVQSTKNNAGVYEQKNEFVTLFNSSHYKFNSILNENIDFDKMAITIVKKKYEENSPIDTFEVKKISEFYKKKHKETVNNTYKVINIVSGTSYSNRSLNNHRYCVVDTFEKVNWKILEDTVTINGILCQKAEGIFVGKLYQVYFSLNYHFSIGPYYMNGLPGIIVLAESVYGNTKFELTKLDYPIKNFITSNECENNSTQISISEWNEMTKKAFDSKKAQFQTKN